MLYTSISSKQRILAQKSSKLTRKSIRWLVALSSIPLFGIVTAFGIAPKTPSFSEVQVEEVVLDLDLSIPEALSEAQTNQTFWRQENIRRGDTIAAILNRLDVSNQDSSDFLQAARSSRAMRSGPMKNAVCWCRNVVQCRSGLVRGTWSATRPKARALRIVRSSCRMWVDGSSRAPKRVRMRVK